MMVSLFFEAKTPTLVAAVTPAAWDQLCTSTYLLIDSSMKVKTLGQTAVPQYQVIPTGNTAANQRGQLNCSTRQLLINRSLTVQRLNITANPLLQVAQVRSLNSDDFWRDETHLCN